MPTHQGKTQTDIVIADTGDSAAEHSEFASSCATSAHVGRAHARDWAAACLLLLPAAARLRRRKRPKVTA